MITLGGIGGINTVKVFSGSEQSSRQAEQTAQTGKKEASCGRMIILYSVLNLHQITSLNFSGELDCREVV